MSDNITFDDNNISDNITLDDNNIDEIYEGCIVLPSDGNYDTTIIGDYGNFYPRTDLTYILNLMNISHDTYIGEVGENDTYVDNIYYEEEINIGDYNSLYPSLNPINASHENYVEENFIYNNE